MQDYKASLA